MFSNHLSLLKLIKLNIQTVEEPLQWSNSLGLTAISTGLVRGNFEAASCAAIETLTHFIPGLDCLSPKAP